MESLRGSRLLGERTSGSSRLLQALVVALVMTGATSALGNPTSPEARTLFDRGLALVGEGDLYQAIHAFEAAHRASPHFAVLYNLGQAYAAVGRSDDAIRVLEAYLAAAGEKASARRRQAVVELVARERSRLAMMDFTVSPPDAEVLLDGALREDLMRFPVALRAGSHVLLARHAHYVTQVVQLELAAGETRRVELQLAAAPDPEASSGTLAIACATPGVRLEIDGRDHAASSSELSVTLGVGVHSVRLSRDGYVPTVRSVRIEQGRTVHLACDLALDVRSSLGRLRVAASEPEATVTIDGKPYRGELLAKGPHALRVELEGFIVHERMVSIVPGSSRAVRVTLQPTVATRRRRAALRSRRIWSLGAGALGAALGGAAVTTAIWNQGRYNDWKRDRDRFREALLRDAPPSEISSRSGSLSRTAAQLQRTDDVAVGLALAAGSALATASILWFTTWLDGTEDDPER